MGQDAQSEDQCRDRKECVILTTEASGELNPAGQRADHQAQPHPQTYRSAPPVVLTLADEYQNCYKEHYRHTRNDHFEPPCRLDFSKFFVFVGHCLNPASLALQDGQTLCPC